MPVSSNPESREPINPKTAKTFWGIILTTWSIEEVDNLAGFAKSVERSIRW